jgi:hypothetical protein
MEGTGAARTGANRATKLPGTALGELGNMMSRRFIMI